MMGNLDCGEKVSGDQFPMILSHSHVLHQIASNIARCLPRCSLTGRGAVPQINLMRVPPAWYVSPCNPLMLEFSYLEIDSLVSFLLC